MQFTIPINELYPAVKQASSLCKQKSPLPILSCCLLRVQDERLTVRATNLEIGVSISMPVEAKEEGCCCLNGSRIEEIVRELKAGICSQIPGGENLSLDADGVGFAKIKAAKSNFKLAIRDPQDYPEDSFSKGDGIELTMEAEVLKGLIIRSVYACSVDKGNNAISGVLFHADGTSLTLAATDGHRLAVLQREMNCLGNVDTILPAESLKYLLGMLKDGDIVSCYLKENGASFSGDGWTLSMRALEGPFPEYDYVIPKYPTRIVGVNREGLLGTLRRVSLMSDERFKPVVVTASEGEMVISSSLPEAGEANESLECELKGDEITLGFNARYLMEALNVMDAKDVQMEITDFLSAVIIREIGDRGRDELSVVMPMNLNK